MESNQHYAVSKRKSARVENAGLFGMLYLHDYLRNPTLCIDVFKRYLKPFLFAQHKYDAIQHIRNIVPLRYINSLIDWLTDWLIDWLENARKRKLSISRNPSEIECEYHAIAYVRHWHRQVQNTVRFNNRLTIIIIPPCILVQHFRVIITYIFSRPIDYLTDWLPDWGTLKMQDWKMRH